MHRKFWMALFVEGGFGLATLIAQPTPDQPAHVEQASPSATVAADTTGFTIQSNDGNFKLKIGADLQVDNRSFYGAGSDVLADGTLLRRARPTFLGTVYKYVDYYFRPDFGQGQTIIYDAYVQFNYFPRFQLRVGKFKPPVGLERLQSDDDTTFVERGLPTLLAPSRDIGYQLSGDIVRRRVGYQVGVFNDVPDNGLSDAAPTGHKDYAARLFLTPFLPNTESVLKGLAFGMAATAGTVDGIALPSFKTFGQSSFFPFAKGVTEAGHRTRLAPQAYYYFGPFGLLTEYTLNTQGLQTGGLRREVTFRSWQVQGSYILTGEAKGFASPVPDSPFDPQHGGWGAIELAGRVGEFRADDAIYSGGFASAQAAPRRTEEWVGSANWYLNRLVRTSVSYGNTHFWGAVRPTERALLLRFQINFV